MSKVKVMTLPVRKGGPIISTKFYNEGQWDKLNSTRLSTPLIGCAKLPT